MSKFLAYLIPLVTFASAYAEDVKDLPPQAGTASIIAVSHTKLMNLENMNASPEIVRVG